MTDDAKEKEVLSPVEWLIAVLSDVVSEHNPRFAGLGLVLYTPPMDLPVTPLIPAALATNLPCRELAESIELLRRLSDTQSPLHDGFHLVDANTMAITHVCLFLRHRSLVICHNRFPITPSVRDSWQPCLDLSCNP